jgi:hypothetical protein
MIFLQESTNYYQIEFSASYLILIEEINFQYSLYYIKYLLGLLFFESSYSQFSLII